MSNSRATELAEKATEKLWRISLFGRSEPGEGEPFSTVYSNVGKGGEGDFLCDFYPDLPWDKTRRDSLHWMCTNEGARKKIDAFTRYVRLHGLSAPDFDMGEELRAALAEDEEENSNG